jgi:demethylmacrocin O-methyltransferase
MTELCEIFYKYKSDKCPKIFHSYSPVYFEYLNEKKIEMENIIEIGVGTENLMKPICGSDYMIGASLKSWRDFFPNSTVFGLDIDNSVLFEDLRIKCFFTDQSKSESLLSTISEIKKYKGDENLEFDLIIDDGSHIVEHMILSFKTLSSFIKKKGYYIIEDIKKKDLEIFKQIEIDGFKIKKIHEGTFEWDGFIIYEKI